MNSQFEIRLLTINWLQNTDEEKDLCAHGKVFVRIENEVLSDLENQEWTVSSTALYLMRTISEDYEIGNYASQLVPCCGFCFIKDKQSNRVVILGCPNGIDWTIHHVGNTVVHTSVNGETAKITQDTYKRQVLDFVNEVESFYRISKPKELPSDKEDIEAYQLFWNEWKELKQSTSR